MTRAVQTRKPIVVPALLAELLQHPRVMAADGRGAQPAEGNSSESFKPVFFLFFFLTPREIFFFSSLFSALMVPVGG